MSDPGSPLTEIQAKVTPPGDEDLGAVQSTQRFG